MATLPKKLSDYLSFNPITSSTGKFNIADTTTPTLVKQTPSLLQTNSTAPINFTPTVPMNQSLVALFKPTAAAPAPVAVPPATPGIPVARPVVPNAGNPSAPPVVVPPGATGAAPANQNPIPAQWRRADGSIKTPEEIAAEIGGALKSAHGTGDVGKLALEQFGNQDKSAAQLEAEARRVGNTRNDIAVGETDPYKVASQSGIAYTPAELKAIESAYAGVYDPALDTALAKVTEKQSSDKAAADAKNATDLALYKAQLDAAQPYTLSKDQVRYDGDGNPIAGGGGAGGNVTYVAGQNPVVDAYVKGFGTLYKASDIPDQYKDLVAQGVSGNKPNLSKNSTDAISIIDELSVDPSLKDISGFRILNPTSLFPGTAVQSTQNLAKQLAGILALQNRTQLKGSGAISDFEFRVLGEASSALGLDDNGRTNLSPDDFKTQLAKLKLKLQVGETNLTDDELLFLQAKGYSPDEIRDYGQSSFKDVGNTTASTGNRPQRNNNPGNEKAGGLADSLATGKDDQNHLIFPTAADGFKALTLDLTAKINGASRYLPANPTIAELGKVYAEDPNWSKKVAMMLGVGVDTKTQSVPLDKLVKAVATQEGFYA